MTVSEEPGENLLREKLGANGQRFTEQRAAVFRFLMETRAHPTADDVFHHVRGELPGISLATVYKSLETLVGCGLATKLTYGDGSARYDGRTDPHPHVRCLACGRVSDVPGGAPSSDPGWFDARPGGFRIVACRLVLEGYCADCDSERKGPPAEELRS
jgi:Fe2+ or Zn2+ uptake regulation protein